jgi:hypothetical protein
MKTYLDTFVIINEQIENKEVISSKKKSHQIMCMC